MVISRVYESIHKALTLNFCVCVCVCVCVSLWTTFCALKTLLLIIIINTYIYTSTYINPEVSFTKGIRVNGSVNLLPLKPPE